MKSRITLRLSLLLLSLLPFTAYLITSFNQFKLNLNDMTTITNQQRNSEYIEHSSSLTLYLQRERGSSSTLINGGDVQVIVTENRKLVNLAFIGLKKALEKSSFNKTANVEVDKLKQAVVLLRNKVNNRSLDFIETMEGYSEIVNELFKINDIAAKEKTTAGIGKLFISINLLQVAQENAGRFRGYMSSVISKDRTLNQNIFLKLLKDFNGIALNLDSRGVSLSGESEQLKKDLLNSADWNSLTNAVSILSKQYTKGSYGLSQKLFWDNASAVVNQIHKIVEIELNEIKIKNEDSYNRIKRAFITQLVILILSFALIILLSFYLILRITKRFRKITNRLNEISAGGEDLTAEVSVDSVCPKTV